MLNKLLIFLPQSVRDVISYMEENLLKAVLVVNDQKVLKGLFTYGDMRHYFLNGGNLTSSIEDAMNKEPIVFYSFEEVEQIRKERQLVIYPIIDKDGHVIDAITNERYRVDEKINDFLKDVPLVIMAGGKGTRLYPYTKILPKALLPIGDYTITERIISGFQKYGCHNVFMVLNYKANMIKAYFNEIERSYDVEYIQEKEFLGTAGGLRLLKGKLNEAFFVSNCDIIVNADLECVYKTHKMNGNIITFVCAMKNVMIPYGVVETDGCGNITMMQEKPEYSYLVNTGLYLVEPEVIEYIQDDEFVHMPELARRYMEEGKKVGVFPVSEKAWMDMGQFKEMETMIKNLGI